MSASLVGSEMCIRDSGSSLPGTPQRCPRTRQGRVQPRGTPARAGRRAPPVSYTHLTLPTICSV
eukprot:3510586-Alexandrium_andersonii.AAC.1